MNGNLTQKQSETRIWLNHEHGFMFTLMTFAALSNVHIYIYAYIHIYIYEIPLGSVLPPNISLLHLHMSNTIHVLNI